MREILFRGKRADNHQWVEGFLYFDNTGDKENPNPWILNDKGKYRVSHSTIGQFTGEIDTSEKNIFEGDIVHVHDCLLRSDSPLHEFHGMIDFKHGSFVITDGLLTHYRWMDYEVTVIGNRWDTPELREKTIGTRRKEKRGWKNG